MQLLCREIIEFNDSSGNERLMQIFIERHVRKLIVCFRVGIVGTEVSFRFLAQSAPAKGSSEAVATTVARLPFGSHVRVHGNRCTCPTKPLKALLHTLRNLVLACGSVFKIFHVERELLVKVSDVIRGIQLGFEWRDDFFLN